jgi:hypothetical protein
MSWISRTRTIWRLAVLILGVAAIAGPWTYTADGVGPVEYCKPPHVLLESDRCVRLVPWTEAFGFMAAAFAQMSVALITGRLALAERGREFVGVALFTAGAVLLVLPLLATLLALLGRARRRARTFRAAAWGVAGLVALLAAVVLGAPGSHLALWGIWLFVGLAVVALTMELLCVAGARVSRGNAEQSAGQAATPNAQ